MGLKSQQLFEFGPFVLDKARHLLTRQGNPVAVTPKTYDLLLTLVENRERIMLKDELMRALWPDSFVEESNLTQQISAARKALGESAGEDRYIVTVPGRGYRFAAPVREPGISAHTDRHRVSNSMRRRPDSQWPTLSGSTRNSAAIVVCLMRNSLRRCRMS
jgi:DNA-binding winged helix-turn-helix (wHTH) protein